MNFLKVRFYSVLKGLVSLIFILYPIARSFHYTSFYLAVGIAAYLFVLVSIKEKFITRSVMNAKWTYLFFAAPFLSSVWSIMPTHSVFHAALLLAFGVIFSISHILFLRDDINWLYRLIPYSLVAFALVFTIILFYFGAVRVRGPAKELIGPISNQIPALTLPFAPYLYVMWKKRKKTVVVLLSSVLLLYIVALSESRAAYGLLFSYLLLIPYFMSDRFTYVIKRLVTFSVMGVIAVGGLYLFAGPEVFLSVLERFRESQLLQLEFDVEESSGDFGRAIMLLEAYNIVTTNPLTGIGYYTFKTYIESRYSFGVISHNILLSIWGEMGIFGFVTFVGMVSTAFRLAGKGQKGARTRGDTERWLFLGASKAALVVLLVHAIVRPQLTNPALWIVVAACLGVGWANRDHRSMPRTANSVSSVTS